MHQKLLSHLKANCYSSYRINPCTENAIWVICTLHQSKWSGLRDLCRNECTPENLQTPKSTLDSILHSRTGWICISMLGNKQWESLSLTKGNSDTLAGLLLPPPSSGVNTECYFWCSSGAGVQLYFTLLWRCAKRQLWAEWSARLPHTTPEQNLGRKRENREKSEVKGRNVSSWCF